jgi:hypothetical protein
MALTREQAKAQLKALVAVDGALQIILPFHACQPLAARLTDDAIAQDRKLAKDHPKTFGQIAKSCDAHTADSGHSVKSPLHFHMVPVKRIEQDEHNEQFMAAFADDGAANSHTRGEPVALLARLTEFQRA